MFAELERKMTATAMCFADRPKSWFIAIVTRHEHEELLKLEASKLAKMGPVVDGLVRGMKLVESCESDDKPAIFRDEPWDSKAVVRQGVVAISSLDAMCDVPGVKKVLTLLISKAKGSMLDAVLKLRTAKSGDQEAFKDASDVTSKLEAMDSSSKDLPEEVIATVQKYAENFAPLQECVQGVVVKAVTGVIVLVVVVVASAVARLPCLARFPGSSPMRGACELLLVLGR